MLARPRVVIIDDDVAVLSLLCKLFDEEGWVVIPCPDGSIALSILELNRPDVVVLDVRLDTPQRGWEILRNARRTDWGSTLPVVICTGAETTGAEAGSSVSGPTEVVAKPFELDDLISTVTRCLHWRAIAAGSDASPSCQGGHGR